MPNSLYVKIYEKMWNRVVLVNSFTTIRVLAGTKKLAQNTTINTMVSFRRLQRRGFYS